jgi:hypothetical protein
MWKPEHRRTADRRGLRYPSDLTDAEWGAGGTGNSAGQARRPVRHAELVVHGGGVLIIQIRERRTKSYSLGRPTVNSLKRFLIAAELSVVTSPCPVGSCPYVRRVAPSRLHARHPPPNPGNRRQSSALGAHVRAAFSNKLYSYLIGGVPLRIEMSLGRRIARGCPGRKAEYHDSDNDEKQVALHRRLLGSAYKHRHTRRVSTARGTI